MQKQTDLNKGNVDDAGDPVRWRVLIVLLGAISMSLISVSIVNVALPAIQEGLDASHSDLQWVLSGYALTFGVVLIAAGRAGDIMGRGGIFIIGMVVFTAASVASGLAPNATSLNIARFIQGVGSGLLSPQGVGMIQQYFRGGERGRAFGYFGSVVGVSVGIGPILGGLLIEFGGIELGWRLTFLVNVPIGIATLIMAFIWFPKPLFHHGSSGSMSFYHRTLHVCRSLDPVGSLLVGLAVFAILLPFMESRTSMLNWLWLPVGVALVAVWVRWERYYARQGRSPMVDLDIFAIRSFTNGSMIMTLYFLGMTSIWVLVALYMQEGIGKTALESGMVGIPSALIAAMSANWAGKRVTRYGRKVVIGGLCCAVSGMGLCIAVVLLNAGGYISPWWLMLALAFVGLAQGAVISPNQTLTLAEVPLAYAGSSGAIMQTGQRIGTSVGIAVLTAVVFALLDKTSWPVAAACGFGLIALVICGALGIAVKDQHNRRHVQQ
ncbi:MAG: MFS transporter [Halomonas sp.]|nr:MFS transporter [Halomonas sp.]MDN6298373.1 MFS transporter [Halomonas sp.]MDN6315259.1 MFS transporter [Halomonas sp.]MDN6336631.1 MFS transporter [Halomonas sp.]